MGLEVVQRYAEVILKSEKDLLIISVGAFADYNFVKSIEKVCEQYQRKVYLPTGAIGGLDAVRAAMSLNELEHLSITTRKPAHALTNKPVTSETVIYEGTAKDAIDFFPKNMNVSIILSLVGKGINNTFVKLIADPNVDKNIHIIKAKGSFGSLEFKIENEAMPGNIKTSYLTCLSVLSRIKVAQDFNKSKSMHRV